MGFEDTAFRRLGVQGHAFKFAIGDVAEVSSPLNPKPGFYTKPLKLQAQALKPSPSFHAFSALRTQR